VHRTGFLLPRAKPEEHMLKLKPAFISAALSVQESGGDQCDRWLKTR
jgi:hypothetical protein